MTFAGPNAGSSETRAAKRELRSSAEMVVAGGVMSAAMAMTTMTTAAAALAQSPRLR